MNKLKENILNDAKNGSGDTTDTSNETINTSNETTNTSNEITSPTTNATSKTTSPTNNATTIRSNDTYVYGAGMLAVLAIGVCVLFAYKTFPKNKKLVNKKQDQTLKRRHML